MEPDAFTPLDWHAPLDPETYQRAAPPGCMVKGMFFADILTALKACGPLPLPRERYVAFKDYPLSEWMEVLLLAARALYPGDSLRQGLRLLGQRGYPTFAQSLAGKAVLSITGNSVAGIFKVAEKALTVCQTFGSLKAELLQDSSALVRLRQCWDFADSYYAGVVEGAVMAVGRRPTLQVRHISLADVDFHVHWV